MSGGYGQTPYGATTPVPVAQPYGLQPPPVQPVAAPAPGTSLPNAVQLNRLLTLSSPVMKAPVDPYHQQQVQLQQQVLQLQQQSQQLLQQHQSSLATPVTLTDRI